MTARRQLVYALLAALVFNLSLWVAGPTGALIALYAVGFSAVQFLAAAQRQMQDQNLVETHELRARIEALARFQRELDARGSFDRAALVAGITDLGAEGGAS